MTRAPPERSPVPPPVDLKDRMVAFVRDLQDRLTAAYERVDGSARAVESTWDRPNDGGGGACASSAGSAWRKRART